MTNVEDKQHYAAKEFSENKNEKFSSKSARKTHKTRERDDDPLGNRSRTYTKRVPTPDGQRPRTNRFRRRRRRASPRAGRARRSGRRLRRCRSGRPPLAANRTDRYARNLRDSTAALACARVYGCQRDGTKRLVSSLTRVRLASLRTCAPKNAFRGEPGFPLEQQQAAAAAGRGALDGQSTILGSLGSVRGAVETR